MKTRLLLLSVLLTFHALPAYAVAAEAEAPLTLARVIEISSTGAPEVRLADMAIAEGEARLAGARVRALENPKLELNAGPRNGNGTSLDAELALEIPVELGGRRDRRIEVALASIRRERLTVEEVRRQSTSAAVAAYYRVLQAEERLALAHERKSVADDLLRVAKERHAAGDVANFEVNLTRSEVARAESDVSSAKGRMAAARGSLAKLLGLPTARELRTAGSIKDRSFFDGILSAPAPQDRADLQGALAEVEASRAAIALAEAQRRPDLSFRVSVKREGDENVALGGISVGLPFFNPRKAEVQEARVRQRRAQLAAEIGKTALEAEIEGARDAYAAAREAVQRMEADAVALQKENESLAQESYRAGKINLATLLQLRRDGLETRQVYLERLLEAAEAGVELALTSGAWTTTK